jgi:hypothetical protein
MSLILKKTAEGAADKNISAKAQPGRSSGLKPPLFSHDVSPRGNMKIIFGALIIILLFAPQSIFANDGFAALGVGGVTISKTDKVAIKRELLDISCDNIRVAYDFVNESDHDENAIIMFPLPSYPANPAESGVIAHGQPSGFSIHVDGKPIAYETEVKATQKGRDVTNDLKYTGFTIEQIARLPFDETLINIYHELIIPKSQIEALMEKGLVVNGNPDWNINVTYVWKQKFPAKAIVHIEHSYHPFIAEGTASGYSGQNKELSRSIHESGGKDIFDFCPSEQQLKQLDLLLANKENLDAFNQVPGTMIEYLLTTATSWKDGIRDFTLRIHTKAKEEIVALCFPSKFIKVSDTIYETHIDNFKPQTELSVYIGNTRECSNGYGEPPQFR